MKAPCPSCGAEVVFKSSISVFSVCQYCKTMIVRRDMDLKSIGKMAAMPDDFSPLKLGTTGKYKGKRFELAGRLRVGWEDGAWNEWRMLFEDGSTGWLGEAQGFLTASFPANVTGKIVSTDAMKPGMEVELVKGRRFKVDDIKKATCIGSEGELPFTGEKGRESVSVDFSGEGGIYANLDVSESDGVMLFLGEYAEFASFEFANLRDTGGGGVAGLNQRKVAAKMFKCPSCGGSVTLRAPGQSVSLACQFCAALIDVKDENFRILSEAQEKMKRVEPSLPIGQKGKLFGDEWEVIGFMQRSDSNGQYPWKEYLLFNPTKGFRWLSEYLGHWTWYEMTRTKIANLIGHSCQMEGRNYKLFDRGVAVTRFVLGEFYWRVSAGDSAPVEEYISPPHSLSREMGDGETIWSTGVYVESADVKSAFKIASGFPHPSGVGMVQPNPRSETIERIGKWIWRFLAALLVIQVGSIMMAKSSVVYQGDFVCDPSDPQKVKVTEPFQLTGGVSNLETRIVAPVDNSWVAANMDLVDELTLETIEFSVESSYYHGRDSDGDWTEGSRENYFDLPMLKPGFYHFNVEPECAPESKGISFSVQAVRDTPNWSNYILATIVLLLYPLFVLWRKTSFEVKRWSNSDFSPYVSEDDD